MFKRLFLIFSIALLFSGNVMANHFMGGEITWDCQGGGQYIFTLKLYRDCNGTTVPPSLTLTVTNHPTVTSIPVNLVSQTDISPVCNTAGPAITCPLAEGEPGWPLSATPVPGAVQESVYQSGLVTLTGVPPAAGWAFTYDDCCRNASILNLVNPSAAGFTLRAIMHSYNGQNAGPCFDSSPKFLESPSTVICLGYPYTYNHNAYDPDLDSLHYSWAAPLDDIAGASFNPPTDPSPLTFATGFSFTSPLPGPSINPANVPATINPATGEISFTSYTQGNYVTVVKVEAWKCGQLVAEIYREIQIVLLPCGSNNPPLVTYTTYQDTVVAGAAVNFTITGTDPEFLSDGVTPQTVSISATGTELGIPVSGTAGCSHPPCATLSPATPTSGPATATTTFNWQTSCNHISTANCNSHSNTYTFVFKTKDDFCPAPAENISTVSITVLAPPTVLSPQPRCVSVLPSGDVTLNWSVPVDTGGTFNAYLIYTSNSVGGPFTLLDSIFTYSQNTYTHVGAGANAAPVYYYIVTRSGCFVSPPLDTINSIHLNVINPGNGTAVLNWNAIASPNLVSSTGVYNIYLEYPAGVWTLTGTTTNLNFIDTIMVCNANINFRVEIADTSGCTSVSSINGGLFSNVIAPSIPTIDTVSVNDSNMAMLDWNVSNTGDVNAYIVYLYSGGFATPVDTVYGINNVSYTNTGSTAGTASEQYVLAAIDSCGNLSPFGTPSNTIFVSVVADICQRSVVLTWNAASSFGAGIAGYRIYQSSVSAIGPYALMGTVSSATLTFTVSSLLPNTTYYYKVEAFDGVSKTVSSNRVSFFSAVPVPPLFSYLRKVSVVDPDHVDVVCHVDVAASTLSYKIIRSTDTDSAHYTQVGSVPASASTPILFSDYTVKPDKHSYFYRVINVDSCGYDGIETNIGKTILLNAVSQPGLQNKLTWNDYQTWLGNVMSYNIYRGIDGAMDPTPIANVPYVGGANTYTDDVSALLTGEGVFNYYVEALEGMGNTYGFSENSLSNIAEAYQDPLVYIPNAFRPAGSNAIFIPVTTFVDFTEYDFEIFNRWGLQMFASTDIDKGWDGTHGGTKCEEGVYVYLVRFKTSRGEYLEFKGSVTLIR